jgi:hypothetical protein
MTGFKSKKTAALDEDGMYLVHHTAQELTLQEQLNKAYAAVNKAHAERAKAWAEIDRIEKQMEQQDD